MRELKMNEDEASREGAHLEVQDFKAFEGSDACSGSGAREGTIHAVPPLPSRPCRPSPPPPPPARASSSPSSSLVASFIPQFPLPFLLCFISSPSRSRGCDPAPRHHLRRTAAGVSTNKESFLSSLSPFHPSSSSPSSRGREGCCVLQRSTTL
jgi:hypothetical protein